MASDVRFCTSCGRTVDTGSRHCPFCGHDSQEHAHKALQPLEESIEGGVRALLYIGSIFVPLAGFIIGAIFLTNTGPEHKRVGKTCLMLGVIGILMPVILAVLFYAVIIS